VGLAVLPGSLAEPSCRGADSQGRASIAGVVFRDANTNGWFELNFELETDN
jgi:hypothetical protein